LGEGVGLGFVDGVGLGDGDVRGVCVGLVRGVGVGVCAAGCARTPAVTKAVSVA